MGRSLFDYPGEPEQPGDAPVFFARRSAADWTRLLAYTTTLRFDAGDLLVRQDETARSLYFLTSGTVEVVLHLGDRRETRIATIRAGSVFGEIAFLDGQPRSGTVRAREGGEVLRLDFEAFEALTARAPSLANAILLDLSRIVATRLREADALLSAQTK